VTAAYRDAVEYLAALEARRGWDLGLDRVRRALAIRGNPERRFDVLHVGGTNGKGSTAAVLDAVLRAAGWRTGLYTSPHLVDFCERIRAGGGTIPEETVATCVDELRRDLARHDLPLTHFEFVTVLAFEWFARIGVEIAVVEVGLGGRLDATNVVTPLAAVITSIAREHEEFLGEGLTAIATEKAGIVKDGVPLVIGALPAEAERVIATTARGRGAPTFRLDVDARLDGGVEAASFEGPGVGWEGLRLPWSAPWQRSAIGLALLTLATVRDSVQVSEDAVRRGLTSVRWPGRLTELAGPPRILLDGAHNPAGAEALAAELPRVLRGHAVPLLFACGRDRSCDAIVSAIAPWIERAVVTEVGRRPTPASSAARAFAARSVPVEVEVDPARAIERMVACEAAGPVLVTGSLFLVGAVLARFEDRLWPPWNGWEVDGRKPPR